MARHKEFDPGEAMKEAMEAFWERGYHGTSVNDLLAEMKLNRGSLYGTFGDKKSLFLAALGEYEKQGRQVVQEILNRPGSAKAAVREFVNTLGEMCAAQEGQRGCLALKAAMEMAPHDEDVAKWVRDVAREREQMLAKVIKRGQSEGEISGKVESRALARYILTALTGLKVMGVSSPSPKEVREVLSLILRVLDE